MARDQVKILPAAGVPLGYALPKNAGDTMLIVFFEGIQKDTMVSVKDMDWAVIDEQCNQLKPIGFGFRFRSSDEPVMLIGKLTSGSVTSFEGESKPLLALIFVAPKKTTTATLRGPQRKEYRMSVSTDWLPKDENSLTGARLSKDGFIQVPLAGGENWTQSGASVTSVPP